MSATFTVTPNGGSALVFNELKNLPKVAGATKAVRAALTMSTGNPSRDLAVWHVPGTNGNIVCDLGYAGQTITAVALYAGPYSDAIRAYENDKYLMSQTYSSITDPAGWTHNRCRLKDSREQMPPKGYQHHYVVFTVTYIFDQHGPQTQGAQGAI